MCRRALLANWSIGASVIQRTLRRTLTDLLGMRHKAAYRAASVSQREAAQAVRRAQEFVREVTVRLSQSGEP